MINSGKDLLFALNTKLGGNEVAGYVTLHFCDEMDDVEPVAFGVVDHFHAVALLERHVSVVARLVVIHGDHDAPFHRWELCRPRRRRPRRPDEVGMCPLRVWCVTVSIGYWQPCQC